MREEKSIINENTSEFDNTNDEIMDADIICKVVNYRFEYGSKFVVHIIILDEINHYNLLPEGRLTNRRMKIVIEVYFLLLLTDK